MCGEASNGIMTLLRCAMGYVKLLLVDNKDMVVGQYIDNNNIKPYHQYVYSEVTNVNGITPPPLRRRKL